MRGSLSSCGIDGFGYAVKIDGAAPGLLVLPLRERNEPWIVVMPGDGPFPGSVYCVDAARSFYDAHATSGGRSYRLRGLVRVGACAGKPVSGVLSIDIPAGERTR